MYNFKQTNPFQQGEDLLHQGIKVIIIKWLWDLRAKPGIFGHYILITCFSSLLPSLLIISSSLAHLLLPCYYHIIASAYYYSNNGFIIAHYYICYYMIMTLIITHYYICFYIIITYYYQVITRAEVHSSFITTTVLEESQVTPQGRHR